MATITKSDLIARLSELDEPSKVERQVEAAIAALGFAGKSVFNGSEVIAIGTRLAEDAQAELAASDDPAKQAQAAAMAPYVQTMREDVLPNLDPER